MGGCMSVQYYGYFTMLQNLKIAFFSLDEVKFSVLS